MEFESMTFREHPQLEGNQKPTCYQGRLFNNWGILPVALSCVPRTFTPLASGTKVSNTRKNRHEGRHEGDKINLIGLNHLRLVSSRTDPHILRKELPEKIQWTRMDQKRYSH